MQSVVNKARNPNGLFFLAIAFLVFSPFAISAPACAQGAAVSLATGAPANPPPQAAPAYTQEQLDQMLAPIALYPDSLVGQILMASTYPLEVVEAYRWQQNPANAGLQGDQLEAALDQQPWDPSVKSLVAFPQVLKTLDDNLQWTEQLGDAFLAQQADVMNAVQHLRARAEAAGTLQSTPQETVATQASDIIITPANPDLVYVPDYNPLYVYGDWPYGDYPPYCFPDITAYGTVVTFGYGIAVADWFWGWNHWDWRNHRLDIDGRRFAALNRGVAPRANGVWRYDPAHRHGVPYRSTATRAQFQPNANSVVARSSRGYAAPASAPAPAPQARGNEAAHNAVFNHYARQPENTRRTGPAPVINAPVSRPAAAPEIPRAPEENFARPVSVPMRPAPSPAPAPVFESFSRGAADVHSESARGAYSRTSAPAPEIRAPEARAPQVFRSAPPAPASHPQGGGRGGNDTNMRR